MDNMIKELHEKFCSQLNEAWQVIMDQPGILQRTGDSIVFKPLARMIIDARRDGFRFLVQKNNEDFIQRYFLAGDGIQQLQSSGLWAHIRAVENLIDTYQEQGNDLMVQRYQDIKNRHLRNLIDRQASAQVVEIGPFYPGKEPDEICVIADTGNIITDIYAVAVCLETPKNHGSQNA